MLHIDVLTLFPDMFRGVFGESILKRALEDGQLQVRLVNFRDFATDKHKTVDDYPFGGGAGMLLKPGPLYDAIQFVKASQVSEAESGTSPRVVLMSPQGKRFTQKMAEEFTREERLIVVCGHYEGFDERIRQTLITDEVSMGDFVLTGGEIPAMALIDSVARLLPGVLGNNVSAHEDSHSTGLLEHPQYTRPAEFEGMRVPETLLSGNHQKIAQWRHVHSLYRTWARRPDLLERINLSPEDIRCMERWEARDFRGIDVLEKLHVRKDEALQSD